MINNEDIIKKFRSFMDKENIDFFIVNATDEYLNEYIDLKINPRYFLTGFSGSTGDVIVTKNEVFLFVDGRYHLQADEETDNTLVNVQKVGMDTSPQQALINKIYELIKNNQTLGLLSSKISYLFFKRLNEKLEEKEIKIKEYSNDPILEIVNANNNNADKNIRHIPLSISGQTSDEKLNLINLKLQEQNLDILLVTKLEEIAYITNLRGNDIPYSSSFKAKAIIENNKCTIFCDINNISEVIQNSVGKSFEFKDKNSFESCLSDFKNSKKLNIGFDPTSTNLYNYRLIENTNNKIVEIAENPISEMKSIKNSAELSHMQECFRKTDIVVNRAITWLNQNLEKGIKISEKNFSDRVKELFFEEGAYGLSFEVLSASGKNTAIIHYTHPSPEKNIEIGELVLLDCGAYFEGGYATDITRTFLAGGRIAKPEEKAKEVYTKVLKSFLNGLYYPVTQETTGFDIDKKVREVLTSDIEDDFKFAHSTGHGVGLPVHEAPPRIGPAEIAKTKLLSGMCFTIEPGLYNNSWGGIRLENTVTLTQKNDKLKIAPLGKARFDENLIDRKYLNQQENNWLNDYQRKAIG